MFPLSPLSNCYTPHSNWNLGTPTPSPSDLNLIEQQRLREKVRRIPSLERTAGLLLQQVHQALNLIMTVNEVPQRDG